MSKRSGPDTELTPEAIEVLNGIHEATETLRDVDLQDIQPAAVFEADS